MISKRSMKRQEMIERIGQLENIIMEFVRRLHNMEIVFEQYVEMKKDSKKFNDFLESKMKQAQEQEVNKDGKSKQTKRKRSRKSS